MNLPENNMNSNAELRMNALRLEMGHRKEVSKLMKIRFGLITFYQCFECCQRGFTLLHSIQGSGERNDLWIQCYLHKYKWDLLCH